MRRRHLLLLLLLCHCQNGTSPPADGDGGAVAAPNPLSPAAVEGNGSEAAPATIATTSTPVATPQKPQGAPELAPAAGDPAVSQDANTFQNANTTLAIGSGATAPSSTVGGSGGGSTGGSSAAPPNPDDPAQNPNHLVNFGRPDPVPSYDATLTNAFVPAEVYQEDDNGYPECEHPPQVDFGYAQVSGCPSTALGVQMPMQGYCHLNYNFKVDVYASNPPASGDHWPSPSHELGVNRYPVAREAWIHSMEHGAVILAYNCPSGCHYELGVMQQAVAARADVKYKVLMTPDPLMPANTFAAISWSWLYLFSTPDLGNLICYIDQHYNHGRENDKIL